MFIHDLASRPIWQHDISKNQDILAAEDLDDDDSQFMTVTIDSSTAKYIYLNPNARPNEDQAANQANGATENDQNLRPAPLEINAPADAGG